MIPLAKKLAGTPVARAPARRGLAWEMLVANHHHILLGDRRKCRHRPQIINRMGTLVASGFFIAG